MSCSFDLDEINQAAQASLDPVPRATQGGVGVDCLSDMKKPGVAIVGGGFSGAAVAFHLARAGLQADILLFEPRARLGGGLAYGGDDPHHRVNVPARFMSLIAEDEGHFVRWLDAEGVLARDPEAFAAGDAYPRRREFGRYVDASLSPYIASGAVNRVGERVVALEQTPEGWRLRTQMQDYRADLVVLAATHPQSVLPAELRPLVGDPRLIADPLADGAVRPIPRDARVLIVGAGLTGADLVAALDAQGHCGPVAMMSRRGLRARGRSEIAHPPEGDFTSAPIRSATALLAAVRSAVRAAESAGRDWHPVFEKLRAEGQQIWRNLDPDARARVVRHLRPYWDAHRFRAAPQIETVVDARIRQGALVVRRARLGAVTPTPLGIEVELRDVRRASSTTQTFDAIVVAVGPTHRDVLRSQPFLRDLGETGVLTLDPTGLGVATSLTARALGRDGRENPTLLIAGPLARGTFGELMGLPQVSVYAEFVAAQAAKALTSPSACDPATCRA